ncbi:hypothetical protein K440DRAFT_135143 [Wilcoxina mikolae CBS 423.85]|nr:hypothetical protein K440DRAFT_135143 [Wilcoxina mikolae CBS 423.85]
MLHGPHRMESTNSDVDEKGKAISQICFREDIEQLIHDRIPPQATLRKTTVESSSSQSNHNGAPSISITTTAYQCLCFAVKHRSTSKLLDEAIILAAIIGLDNIHELTNIQDVGNRMAVFLTMIREIPSDIIFAGVNRIRYPPFRWAPRSLLDFETFKLHSFGPPGVCDNHGFHATYEGFILDGAASSRQRPDHDGKYYAIDRTTGMKYTFKV